MLKAYAMALAVSTTAPVTENTNEKVSAPSKVAKTEVVIKDTTKTEFMDFFFNRGKKKKW